MPTCPNGHANSATARFCETCGVRIDTEVTPLVATPIQPTPTRADPCEVAPPTVAVPSPPPAVPPDRVLTRAVLPTDNGAELKGATEGLGDASPVTASAGSKEPPKRRTTKLIAVLGGVIVLAMAGGAAAFLASRHSPKHLATGNMTTSPPGRLAIVAGVFLPTHVPATSSYLWSPSGVAVDSKGDLFIADSQAPVIWEVTPAGQISVVAGILGKLGLPTPGPATRSRLGDPEAVAVDPQDNLFIADEAADYGNDVIEEVTPAGRLSVVAGIVGKSGPPTPGPATSSRLGEPSGLAVDSQGDLYIADSGNSAGGIAEGSLGNDVIEEVTPAGRLSVVAGIVGKSGPPTPGPATSSRLGEPYAVAVDSRGDLYIADGRTAADGFPNDVVEEVTPAGSLSVLAGIVGKSGPPTPGPATRSRLGDPVGVAVDPHGDLFIADDENEGNDVIEQVTPAGRLSVVAGIVGKSGPPTPGPATRSRLEDPVGVAVDPHGDLFVVDQNFDVPNSLVERITPAGRLSVVAGVVDRSGPPTPGPATRSELDFPSGVAVDPHGDLFIADSGNDDVERVTPAGRLSVVAGIVGKSGPPTPGSATRSELDFPSGVAVDPHGDLFIADTRNNVVEKVTPGGRLSIVAGIVGKSGPPTPGPANGSRLDFFDPSGVAIDSHGDLFIADGGNHVVEEVSPAGRLSVVAGIVGKSGPPTPGPATRSELSQPDAVAVDAHGDVLIADRLNDVVEKVTPAGDLSVIAGVVGDTGLPTPGPAIRSELNPPNGLAVDSRGNLFISDYFSNHVEEVKA